VPDDWSADCVKYLIKMIGYLLKSSGILIFIPAFYFLIMFLCSPILGDTDFTKYLKKFHKKKNKQNNFQKEQKNFDTSSNNSI
jgi:hypothetical protein